MATDPKNPNWRPIHTAPVDQTRVLLWGPTYDEPVIAGWYKGTDQDEPGFEGWSPRFYVSDREPEAFVRIDNPTHWMPLPMPPNA